MTNGHISARTNGHRTTLGYKINKLNRSQRIDVSQFHIPAPFRAWCHLHKECFTIKGIRGKGFLTIDDLTKHSLKEHRIWKG